MLENKTPDPNSQPLKVEDILAKAEEIRNARDRQSSVTNSDLGEAFKLFTVVDEESKLLTTKRESFKIAKLIWKVTGFGEKTLWDVIQIVAVPSALAVADFWFQDFTKKQDVKLAESKTKQELQVADSKAKQETLTKYLDQMSELLEKGLLKSKQDSPIFIIAQSKTVTALQSLDTERQRLLIQFFKSANLNTLDGRKGLLFKARMSKAQLPGIDLSEINLKGVDLSEANLSGANLKGVEFSGSNLSGANLKEANLTRTNLSRANLSRANFKKANLSGANLKEADLISTNIKKADLSNAKLQGTNLIGANFDGSQFRGVNLINVLMLYTDLSNARNLDEEQLEKSNSLFICGSSLPEYIKIDKTRDCTIMPQTLMKRYPKTYKTLKEAKDFIGSDSEGLDAEDEDENKITEKE